MDQSKYLGNSLQILHVDTGGRILTVFVWYLFTLKTGDGFVAVVNEVDDIFISGDDLSTMKSL